MDYKEFLLITNGFTTLNENVDPSFSKISDVAFLKDVDPQLIEIWTENVELLEGAIKLARSIVIGGLTEEQYFLLIPPVIENADWEYWKFASWIPGEHPYQGLENYFINLLDFLKSVIVFSCKTKKVPIFSWDFLCFECFFISIYFLIILEVYLVKLVLLSL